MILATLFLFVCMYVRACVSIFFFFHSHLSLYSLFQSISTTKPDKYYFNHLNGMKIQILSLHEASMYVHTASLLNICKCMSICSRANQCPCARACVCVCQCQVIVARRQMTHVTRSYHRWPEAISCVFASSIELTHPD